MSTTGRRRHSPKFKAQVALEAVREDKTANQIASRHGVHPSRVGLWKRQALERLPELFENGNRRADDQAQWIERLYPKIGRLEVKLNWIKKSWGPARLRNVADGSPLIPRSASDGRAGFWGSAGVVGTTFPGGPGRGTWS